MRLEQVKTRGATPPPCHSNIALIDADAVTAKADHDPIFAIRPLHLCLDVSHRSKYVTVGIKCSYNDHSSNSNNRHGQCAAMQ